MNEFDKCYFCTCYDEYEGCEWGCNNKAGFDPDHDKIIAKAKREAYIGGRCTCFNEYLRWNNEKWRYCYI